jgi:hypothetical protein
VDPNVWRSYFSYLLNAQNVSGVKIYTAETLAPNPSLFRFEIAIANLERFKLPGSDKIPAELI